MGRAIDMEKDIDRLKARVKTLETAFDGLASTVDSLKDTAPTRRNVGLHETTAKSKDSVKTKKTQKSKVKELVTEET